MSGRRENSLGWDDEVSSSVVTTSRECKFTVFVQKNDIIVFSACSIAHTP